jgi:hypothetical protein
MMCHSGIAEGKAGIHAHPLPFAGWLATFSVSELSGLVSGLAGVVRARNDGGL